LQHIDSINTVNTRKNALIVIKLININSEIRGGK